MSDIPYLKLKPIRKGRAWSSNGLQRASNQILIVSSTATTPIVLTLSKPHGYSNGQKVRVSGHDGNTPANGNHTAANVTSKTLELTGAVGDAVGGREGIVAACNDGTGYTLTCKFKRDNADADAAAIITPSITWIDQTRFYFKLTLTAAQTATLSPAVLYFEVKGVLGSDDPITIFEGEVQVFDSTMD